ncbi:MAG: ABC transporter permease [Elusimicrobia bacterium CG08_land_8_20_14_0_20_59_10]|nr:MAG: ABC transporter permease [Elusimicrobia bacterium CG08_land_8_20_14_0_20_59_10]
MKHPITEHIGREFLGLAEALGGAALMFKSVVFWFFRSKFELKETIKQSVKIGVDSFTVTALTSFFTGMVLALQMGSSMKNLFNEPMFIGTMVAFSMIKELGPVLTSIVVAGRAGAVVTAEIGTMKVTEQIDALYTLGTNPTRYLLVPRYIAFLITLPLLTVFADFIGVAGGCIVGMVKLGVPSAVYFDDIFTYLDVGDFLHGFLKTYFFAFMIATVSCYKGLNTKGGAEGVGKSTTEAVVVSMVLVMVLDYFISALLVAVGI